MTVAELMTVNPVTVELNDTLETAHKKMEAGRFRQVPVVDQQKLVGILTDRDTRRHTEQLAHIRVDAVMSGHPFSVHASTPVEKAAHLLTTNKIGGLPVVDDGRLVGIVTASDLLRALEALLGASSDMNSRIDLDLDGSGDISAATSLVQSVCPLLGIGTYRLNHPEREVLYVLVPSTRAQDAARALAKYGFKVLAVHS
jgi:acetoin utilization protein AcuB